jgi:PAS domain S-box-containing protein
MRNGNSKGNHPRRHRPLGPYFVLLLSLLVTSLFSYYVNRAAEAKDQERFRSSAQEISASIQGRIETYVALLRASAGLFAASERVEKEDFRDFVQSLDVQNHYPGIQGIGFSARLEPEQRDALTAAMERAGVGRFHIWPEKARAEYHTIIYLEPLDRRNQAAIGYDMFTEPVRRAAMERARDTGIPAASGRVILVQEIDPEKQAGFLIYTPVYQNGTHPTTVNDRRLALAGFVYSPFRADDLLNGILASRSYDVDFQVYDAEEQKPENLLHDSSARGAEVDPSYRPRFATNATLDVAGRTWNLRFVSRPEFEVGSGKSLARYSLLGGLLLSLILFFVTRSQSHAHATAERSASELRASESKITKSLTERKQVEEALRESEERYRELIENARDIFYTHDVQGNMTSVNKAGELITGYSREELLKMNLGIFLKPGSLDSAEQMLDRKLAGEERSNYEIDIQSKSGRLLTLEISSRLMLKNGKPTGVQGIARDITERRRAEEALREVDQRVLTEYERLLERISGLAQALGTARDLLTIFRSLKDFTVVSVPCNGFFISLHDPVQQVRTACYGWGDGQEVDTSELPAMPITAEGPNSRAVMTGQVIITDDYMNATRGHPSVIVGPDNGLRPQSSLAAPMAVMGRIVGTIEVQSYKRTAYKEEHVTAMRMAANLTAGAIENVRLLERESNARAAAEELNRLKDEFLATVSHELRTPLTAILGWSRMLETDGLESPIAARAIETIRRNAKAQSQIIDDILDVSRIITGNLHIDLHPIELAPVIDAAINVVRPTAEAKGINIQTEFDSRPTVISGDSNRLQQVIWNLLLNAVKFTPTGGQVRIGLHHVESQAEIKVSDSGRGISPDFLPYVFDRFRQADSTTTRQHGGLGLGLAIVRHLVEIHGGSVQADSPGDAKGATFTVRFPLVSSVAGNFRGSPKSDLKADFQPPLTGLHVLVVDDDPDTLEVIAAVLTRREAKVTTVLSAEEAVKAIKRSWPDILVSDIAMPNEDGYALIRMVRELNLDYAESLPAVAITAYAREEDRQRALSSGYQEYLPKPIEPSELITVVANLARRNKPTNGNGDAKQGTQSHESV